MSEHQIHFLYDRAKASDVRFAESLIAKLGQADFKTASEFSTIGGDGILLHALRCSEGRPVAGLVSPDSNSRGFWTNRGIHTADDVVEMFERGTLYALHPLQADIVFADQSAVTRYGYNDVSIRPVHQTPSDGLREKFALSAIDESVQSILVDLRIAFANAAAGPHRIMGSGLIFATPFGSTAMNRNFGGPSIDIRNEGIVLTGIGTTMPAKGFNPVHNAAGTVFEIDIQSPAKRPAIVSFDSFGIVRNQAASPIRALRVSLATTQTANLLLTDDPGSRAYSALTP